MGTYVTFKAVATDANNDSYYLAVCKGPGIQANSSAPPTCTNGTWCVSSLTASGATATCSYLVQESDTNRNYEWYAYVCDDFADQPLCSDLSQGSGDSGSPFVVNHRPNFTSVSNNSPKDPGQTVTWSTIASDPDGDTIKLFVCATNGFDPQTGCTGTTLATSTFVSSNPSASYSIPIPKPDMTYDGYVFIVDQFNLSATGTAQGSNSSWTVNNVPPEIVTSSIQIINHDGSTNYLTLINEEGTTTGYVVRYQIKDNNSCWAEGGKNEITGVSVNVFRTGVTCNSANANNNNCYPNITNFTLETCEGPNDIEVWATTTFTLWYHAEPTVTSTPWETETWNASVKAIDDDGASSAQVTGENPIELQAFLALGIVEPQINYGSIIPDEQSNQQVTNVKATGNTGIDQDLGGNPMVSGSNIIPVERQYWYLASGTNWGELPTSTYRNFLSASTTPVYCQIEVPKSTTTVPASKPTYWRIKVNAAQPRGIYTGMNYFYARMSATTTW